ncbi:MULTISPECIES: ATPase, T2SS/T4P/T4SS family [unclassified Caballeronia]|uniref:ATPase, T2SS/T4P/T4SS family n=1 Tax=unclassified Caballeronia TaxID=2646786 RepID=UPI001F3AD76C|nr:MULTISPECIES: ATPase, T2SS/T4P/T4SS family [unclassified Caballeronia]MCE4548103.1 Flp pilus assembly complex ATPase component TadA [Caballeronia sp. PC1]MCE4575757.1 Flp pilus assembly complex ATPase component TadA [Caballeronia sp. CLC5]
MPLHKAQSFIASDHAVNMTLAPLLPYLEDPAVFEVRINRFGQVVAARTDGREIFHEPAITPAYVNNLTNTLLSYNGLGPSPIMDVMLPNGTRGVIVRPPAVLEGTVLICFRKHLQLRKGLEELQDEGRFSNARRRTIEDMLKLDAVEEKLLALLERRDVVGFMREAVRNRKNICVSGKTGSGKSTLTRTLLAEVASTERVLLLEDVHEVEADNQYEVGYMMYGKQEGRVSAKECLTAAMRLSPDRIFLTELRDDAAWDYLTGANTGHPGGIFSTHADNAATTFARIATLVKASDVGRTVDHDVILKTVITTVDVVIYMADREVKEIYYDPLYRRRQLIG